MAKPILFLSLGGTYLVGTVRFSDTINLGAILLGIVVLVLAGFFTVRANTASIWRQNFEGEKEKNTQLEEAVKELTVAYEKRLSEEKEERHALKTELATERLKTDITPVISKMVELTEEFGNTIKILRDHDERLSAHDRRMQENHEATLDVLLQLRNSIAAIAHSGDG